MLEILIDPISRLASPHEHDSTNPRVGGAPSRRCASVNRDRPSISGAFGPLPGGSDRLHVIHHIARASAPRELRFPALAVPIDVLHPLLEMEREAPAADAELQPDVVRVGVD